MSWNLLSQSKPPRDQQHRFLFMSRSLGGRKCIDASSCTEQICLGFKASVQLVTFWCISYPLLAGNLLCPNIATQNRTFRLCFAYLCALDCISNIDYVLLHNNRQFIIHVALTGSIVSRGMYACLPYNYLNFD